MRKAFAVAILAMFAAAAGRASTISSLTNTVGNSFTINGIGASNVSFNDLVGFATMSVTYSDNSVGACTFASNGRGGGANVGCTDSAGGTQIFLNPPGSQTNSAGWVINNLNSAGGLSIVTVTIDLNPTASGVGYDSGSVATRSGGTSISGSAVLTDALHTSGQLATAATQYGRLILSFSGTTFSGGSQFTFNAANHFLTGPVVSDVPEPTTYAMVGLGLGVLAFLKRRRKV